VLLRKSIQQLLLLTGVIFGIFPATAIAQINGVTEPLKSANLVFTNHRPKIDGVLDDETWVGATIIEDLHQTLPVNGGQPSQKTIFYVAYDRDALYIAARVFETDPDLIVANQLIQGSSIRFDDRINVVLDPYMTQRSGYIFGLNPNGIRGEGLFQGPENINPNWTGIWIGEAKVTKDGWVAEMAIPFKTISFDESLNDWGFSLTRTIARNNERIAWTSLNRRTGPNSAGILRGIGEAQQGVGLDIVPSIAIKSKKINTGYEQVTQVPSINAFYKITPSLTASLTANTDFSGADVDDVVVNLSRFSVFLPEKRGFFLQDADIFGFSDLQENGIPFFSRKIGLSSTGLPVDLVVGGKLSGRINDLNIGVLGVLQDRQPTIDPTNLIVARASLNVFEESNIGLIGTYGDPQSNNDNALGGVDFNYRNTSLIKGKSIEGSIWYQVTQTNGVAEESEAFGGTVAMFARDGFFGAVIHKTLDTNFNPALGFANWTGIRQTETFGGYRRRPDSAYIREITHSFFFQNTKDMDGNLLLRVESFQPFEIISNAGDSARVRVKNIAEVINNPFEISAGNFVLPKEYDYTHTELVLQTSESRKFSWRGEADVGGFYDGYRVRVVNEATYRPNKHFLLGAGLRYNDISLSGGNFITRLGTFRANIAFNNKWSFLNFVQYDNVSDSAALNSRLKWQPKPGDEYVFIVNYGADIGQDGQIYTRDSELILKAARTIRF
jgi:uncharacterized protein DUF5916